MENNNIENKKITLELTMQELFQLNLCVGCRSGFLAQAWATTPDANHAKSYESQTAYLDKLSGKIKKALLDLQNESEGK